MATKEEEDLQTQIYILSGVFGGVCFFLVVSTIFLISSVHRLSKKVSRLSQTAQKNPIVIQGLNADVGGRQYTPDELKQRGYSTYDGNQILQDRTGGSGSGGIYSDRYQPNSYSPSLPPMSPTSAGQMDY